MNTVILPLGGAAIRSGLIVTPHLVTSNSRD